MLFRGRFGVGCLACCGGGGHVAQPALLETVWGIERSRWSKDPLVERVAQLIARWGLATPAITFLEANKPLSFVGSQALLMLQPITDLFLARELSTDLVTLLADRARLEMLLTSLETVEVERKEQ
jgi:hypothetical protein